MGFTRLYSSIKAPMHVEASLPFLMGGVLCFPVTFPSCKAIRENGRRHHQYANCCQITGFAGSALGSGTAAAGASGGPSAPESPRPRGDSAPASPEPSRLHAAFFGELLGSSAWAFLLQGVSECFPFVLRSAGSLMSPVSNWKMKIFRDEDLPPSAHLRGAPRHGAGKRLAHP